MQHFVTFLLQNGTLWDICLMHCGICEMGLLTCQAPKLAEFHDQTVLWLIRRWGKWLLFLIYNFSKTFFVTDIASFPWEIHLHCWLTAYHTCIISWVSMVVVDGLVPIWCQDICNHHADAGWLGIPEALWGNIFEPIKSFFCEWIYLDLKLYLKKKINNHFCIKTSNTLDKYPVISKDE